MFVKPARDFAIPLPIDRDPGTWPESTEGESAACWATDALSVTALVAGLIPMIVRFF